MFAKKFVKPFKLNLAREDCNTRICYEFRKLNFFRPFMKARNCKLFKAARVTSVLIEVCSYVWMISLFESRGSSVGNSDFTDPSWLSCVKLMTAAKRCNFITKSHEDVTEEEIRRGLL